MLIKGATDGETGIQNWTKGLDTIATNALAPCVTRASAVMELTTHSYIPWKWISTYVVSVYLVNQVNTIAADALVPLHRQGISSPVIEFGE